MCGCSRNSDAQPRTHRSLGAADRNERGVASDCRFPTELQPVLDAVTESAVRLASAKRGHIRQYDGEFLRLVASYGESPEQLAVFQAPVRPRVESRSGRAFLERRPIHDLDAQVERHPMAAQTGARTALAVPLLREDTPIGVFTIWRDVVEPFTDRQIELVKTFADQAVVAIENVRLFQELQAQSRLTELWSNRQRRAKFWASSPARRPISSRCLMSWLQTPRGFASAKHASHPSARRRVSALVAQYGESPEYIAHVRANLVPSLRQSLSRPCHTRAEDQPYPRHVGGARGPISRSSARPDRQIEPLLAVPLAARRAFPSE